MRCKALKPGLVTLALLGLGSPGQAVEGPWCAFESTGHDAFTTRCDLPSFEACRAWTQGMAGTWCSQNPRFAPASRVPRASTQRPRTR